MRAGSERSSLFASAGIGLVLALGLLPVLRLVFVAIGARPEPTDTSFAFDARTLGLLARSVGIALSAALGALGLGLAMALPLARLRFRGRGALAGVLFVAFAVSPYWLALGWVRGDLGSNAAQLLVGRPSAVALVLAAAHAPAVALLALLVARSIPVGWEEAALLAAPLRLALLRILLPHLAPQLGVIALLVFALCFSDYEVASLLQVVTYPVEIFLLHASVFAPEQAARACLPLLGVALTTAAGLGVLVSRGLVRQWPSRVGGEWPLTRPQRRMLLALALSTLAGSILLPALGLLSQIHVSATTVATLRTAVPALAHSLATTATSVLLALALGTAASAAIVRARPASRRLLAVVLLIPACLPSPAYAIAWVELVATAPVGLRDALASVPALGPALCIAARWAGLVALLSAAARLAIPASALDAARLQEGRGMRRFSGIELPWIAPVALASAAVLAALAQGAVGILVLTVPPGFEVAPLRIDNLLHYGAREQAVALAVASALLAAAIPLALILAARRLRGRLA